MLLCLCLLLGACSQLSTHSHRDLSSVKFDQLTAEKNYWDSIPGKVKVRDKYRPYRYYLDGDPYTGKLSDSTPSGKLKTTGSLKDGYPEGPWVYYQYNGALDQTGSYEEGYMKGEWKFYDKKGNEKTRLVYTRKNHEMIADTIIVTYKNGYRKENTKAGFAEYYPDGRHQKSEISADGSTGIYWDMQGNIIAEMKDYIKGNRQTNETTFYVAKGTHKKAMDSLLAYEKTKWTEAQKFDFENATSVKITRHDKGVPPPPIGPRNPRAPLYLKGFEVNIETVKPAH